MAKTIAIYRGEWVDQREGKEFSPRSTVKRAKADCERAEQNWTGDSIQWSRYKSGSVKWIGKTKYHTFYINQYEVK